MPLLIQLLLASLASYRLSQMLVFDSLPFGILDRFRTWMLERWGDDSETLGGSLVFLFNCPYCMGFWTTGLALGLVYLNHAISNGILIFFAVWGAQSLFQAYHEGMKP